MLDSPGKGNVFQRRVDTSGLSTHTAGAFVTAPYWVRLTRLGQTITASQSADGATWVVVGTETIAFPQTVLVGLAVSSHSTSASATATFDNVAAGSLWSSQDVGVTGLAGSIWTGGTAPAGGVRVWDGTAKGWAGVAGTYELYGTAAPTATTGANKAGTGSRYLRTASPGGLYVNTGTAASPTWTQV